MVHPLSLGVADAFVWRGMLAVWAFVACCSAVGFAHPRLRRSSVLASITSWWPVTIVGALGCLCGPLFTVVVFTGVGILLLREALRLLPLAEKEREKEQEHHLVVGSVFVFSFVCCAAAARPAFDVVVLALLALPALRWARFGAAGFAVAAGGALWAVLTAGLLWSFLARIVAEGRGPHGGHGAVFVFCLLVMMADAMQFVFGKLLGKTPLAPQTSPKKTVEGLLGALFVVAPLGALVTPPMLGRSAAEGAVVGVVVVGVGLLGDLVLSAWKRDAGVKDSGVVLPGQGGALDRCDSIVFTAPLFWWWAA